MSQPRCRRCLACAAPRRQFPKTERHDPASLFIHTRPRLRRFEEFTRRVLANYSVCHRSLTLFAFALEGLRRFGVVSAKAAAAALELIALASERHQSEAEEVDLLSQFPDAGDAIMATAWAHPASFEVVLSTLRIASLAHCAALRRQLFSHDLCPTVASATHEFAFHPRSRKLCQARGDPPWVERQRPRRTISSYLHWTTTTTPQQSSHQTVVLLTLLSVLPPLSSQVAAQALANCASLPGAPDRIVASSTHRWATKLLANAQLGRDRETHEALARALCSVACCSPEHARRLLDGGDVFEALAASLRAFGAASPELTESAAGITRRLLQPFAHVRYMAAEAGLSDALLGAARGHVGGCGARFAVAVMGAVVRRPSSCCGSNNQ